MSGERNLQKLTKEMGPHLHDHVFVFCTFPDAQLPAGLSPVCTFMEDEGLAVILEKRQAQAHGIPFALESRMITLTVHSSLEAVGFIAAFAGRLALADIPCNVVSAYHHDHLFVPQHLAERAMQVLSDLEGDSRQSPALN